MEGKASKQTMLDLLSLLRSEKDEHIKDSIQRRIKAFLTITFFKMWKIEFFSTFYNYFYVDTFLYIRLSDIKPIQWTIPAVPRIISP